VSAVPRPGSAVAAAARRAGPPFLARDALAVAPDLLGALLRVEAPEGAVVVRLTEVEAYRGADDPGSHAFRGPTRRNAAMFGAAGHLYVYFTYGMHWCANVVCGPTGTASAVLLRAGEVVEGLALARRRRPAARRDADLARGPARLCQALGISGSDDGAPVALAVRPARGATRRPAGHALPGGRGRVALTPARRPVPCARGPRVGVVGPGGDAETYPWRFWIPGEATVSAYRPGRPRGRPARGAGPGTAD
jgi:DNA-3-methyladenine glycosylase